MRAGLPDFVLVNVADLAKLEAGSEVTLESLKEQGVITVSGRDRKLPLKASQDYVQ
jgi:hypothetical protein